MGRTRGHRHRTVAELLEDEQYTRYEDSSKSTTHDRLCER